MNHPSSDMHDSTALGLHTKLAMVEAERGALKRWKQEALVVMSEWDKVEQHLRVHLRPGEAGRTYASIVLDRLTERDQWKAAAIALGEALRWQDKCQKQAQNRSASKEGYDESALRHQTRKALATLDKLTK